MSNDYNSVEELPLTLNASEVADFLGISRSNAYNLLHNNSFPTLKIGKRLLVPRDRLMAWIDEQIKIKHSAW